MDIGQLANNQQDHRPHLRNAKSLFIDLQGCLVLAPTLTSSPKGLQPHQDSLLGLELVIREVLLPAEVEVLDSSALNHLLELGVGHSKAENQVDGHDEIRAIQGIKLLREVHIHQPDPPKSFIDFQTSDRQEDGRGIDLEPDSVET